MEISKVEFNLPIMINGKERYTKSISTEICSENCLKFKGKGVVRSAIPTNSDSYILFTDKNTVIKERKYRESFVWEEFGYKYHINPKDQDEVYNNLLEETIQGLAQVKDFCSCSLEYEYIQGEIADSITNPLDKSRRDKYVTKANWSEEEFQDFIKGSAQLLINLHNNKIVHGDPCGHNMILDNNKNVYMIDLDTLMPFKEAKQVIRDRYIYFFYCVIPLGKKILSPDKFNRLFNLIMHCLKTQGIMRMDLAKLFDYNNFDGNEDEFLFWYYDYLNDNIYKITDENDELRVQTSQLRVQMMENNRIFYSKINEIEKDRKERLKAINILDSKVKSLQKINEEIEKDRKERLKAINILDSEVKSLQKINDEIEKDRKERLEAINILDSEVKSLQKINGEIEKDRKERLKAINILDSEVKSLQKINGEIEKDREERLEAINILDSEVKSLQKINGEIEKDREERLKIINIQEKEIQELLHEINNLKKQNDNLTLEVKSQNNQIDELTLNIETANIKDKENKRILSFIRRRK